MLRPWDRRQEAQILGHLLVQVWRLREELLGWSRPAWAPGAALLADWFSEDDAVYDDIAPEPTR